MRGMTTPPAERAPEEARSGGRISRISIIAPMRNEADHVESFVADVAAQDFDGPVELIVADGGSTDDSVPLLDAAARRAGVDLTIVPNPRRWVSQGLNACIPHASGDLLVRLDCHSRYPPDYLRLCAAAAEESDALAVGGIVVPAGRTPTERAVACAMDSPFGGIGWMRGTIGAMRRDSDILTYGAFRPEAFRRAGLFDETLLRNQDDEFTLRIRQTGGRVLLDSRIKVLYTPRGSYRDVFRQYFQYGYWKVAVMRKHRQVLSSRSLAPPALVASLAALVPLTAFVPVARWVLLGELAVYAGSAVLFGARSLRVRGEPLRLLPRVALIFPTFHVAYGLGLLWALVRTAAER
jgi:succinoglycan biosynthesis protein ExoA